LRAWPNVVDMSLLSAPAKLTWFLEITGRRDDGYHLLRSEMISVSLADSLDIEDAATNTLTLSGSREALRNVPADSTNLVVRALSAVGRMARVAVTKQIPSGAGLGGGSSDAAAVLRWAKCFDLDVAARLGADVAFCLRGGRALVQGVGELIQPLPHEARELTLILAPFGVNTAACYAAYDELDSSNSSTSQRNHLWEAACAVQPLLRGLHDFVHSETGHEVSLAGSGSTMFIEGFVGDLDDGVAWSSPVGELQVRRVTTTPAQLD
jgi:4-diphosphocytidyl-2-C-methyl-D-erythritol kinase